MSLSGVVVHTSIPQPLEPDRLALWVGGPVLSTQRHCRQRMRWGDSLGDGEAIEGGSTKGASRDWGIVRLPVLHVHMPERGTEGR